MPVALRSHSITLRAPYPNCDVPCNACDTMPVAAGPQAGERALRPALITGVALSNLPQALCAHGGLCLFLRPLSSNRLLEGMWRREKTVFSATYTPRSSQPKAQNLTIHSMRVSLFLCLSLSLCFSLPRLLPLLLSG